MGHLFIVGAELMLGPYSLWQYLFLSFKFGDTKLVSSKETSVSFKGEWCHCFEDWPTLTFNIWFWNISVKNIPCWKKFWVFFFDKSTIFIIGTFYISHEKTFCRLAITPFQNVSKNIWNASLFLIVKLHNQYCHNCLPT